MHKSTIALSMCLIAVFASASLAQVASFRSQATKGVLKDDLDRAAGDATFLGTGYFTTLDTNKNIEIYSNLTNPGATDYLLDPNAASANRFLIGTSGKLFSSLPALSSALFFTLNNTETDQPFVLNGIACNGFGSYSTRTFNNNGTYYDASGDQTNEQTANNYGFLLNNTYKFSDQMRGGLLITRNDNITTDTRAGVAGNAFAELGLLNPTGANVALFAAPFALNAVTQHAFSSIGNETTAQEHNQHINNPTTLFQVGMNRGISDQLNADFFLEGGATRTTTCDSGKYSYSVSQGAGSLLSQSQSVRYNVSAGGVRIGGGGRLNFAFSQNTRSNLTLGYTGIFGDYQNYTTSASSYSNVDATGPNTTTLAVSGNTSDSASNGTHAVNQISFCNMNTFKRGDHLEFGIGVGYQYSHTSNEYTDVVHVAQTTSYTDGTVLGAGNYNGNYSSTVSQKVTDVTDVNLIRFPVGFGYKFGKSLNWEFRMGANADVLLQKRSVERTDDQLLNVNGQFVYNGNTTLLNNLAGTAMTDSRVGVIPAPKQTVVTYSYGLGWQPVDKMKVDLLAFFGGPAAGAGSLLDVNMFRRLALSITFVF